MDQATQTLSDRLERLERENSRMKRSARLMKIIMASAIALCVVFSVPRAFSTPMLKAISAQQISLVNAAGTVLASFGPTSDGNVLTFYDSAGNKTLTLGNNANQSAANLTTWDGNVVIAGSGLPRTVFGEANPNVGPNPGFGGAVFDGSGKERSGFGLSFDLKSNECFAIDTNGTSTGVGIFPTTSFAGYFANDANGINRQFGGLSLDGTSNLWGESDVNGHLRLFATQAPNDTVQHNGRNGNGFVIWDANGVQRAGMFALVDNTLAGFNVVGTNNVDRFAAYLGTNMTVHTYDAGGSVTGSLP